MSSDCKSNYGVLRYDMKKKTVMGPYEKTDGGFWISRESVIEGTVRVVDGFLCEAQPDIMYYDVKESGGRQSEQVIKWAPIDI
jgi:hypothetical protein